MSITPDLTWRDAKRQDRGHIQRFRCTHHEPHRVIERGFTTIMCAKPWEFEVQEAIQCHKPPKKGWIERLGFAGSELATVALSRRVAGEGLALYELSVGAVSAKYRGTGAADAMLSDIFGAIANRSEDGPETRLMALIHHGNIPSKKLATRMGLLFERPDPDDDHLEVWAGKLPGRLD